MSDSIKVILAEDEPSLGMIVKDEVLDNISDDELIKTISLFDLVIMDNLETKDIANIRGMINFSKQKLLVLKAFGEDVSRVKYEYLMKPITFFFSYNLLI